MIPTGDFDAREQRSHRAAYALALLFYAGAYALCRMAYGPVLGFVASSPILGVYFSLFLLHRGGNGLRWFKWLALRKVDGRLHAFQGCPVSVRWSEGQCCVRAIDAFRVLAEAPDGTELRRLALRFGETQFFRDGRGDWWFGERAILEWLQARAARRDSVANKFELWLRREVLPPMHRRAGLG